MDTLAPDELLVREVAKVGENAFYTANQEQLWFAGKIFIEYMSSRARAIRLMEACLSYSTPIPALFLIENDSASIQEKRITATNLFAFRWLLTHETQYEKLVLLESLQNIDFEMSALLLCFDHDMGDIIRMLPSDINDDTFWSIAYSDYGQVLLSLTDPLRPAYTEQDRDICMRFCTIWLKFPSPPSGMFHPGVIIAHFFPLILNSNFAMMVLGEIGDIDSYFEEVVWLMKRIILESENRSKELPFEEFKYLYQIGCRHFSDAYNCHTAREQIIATVRKLGMPEKFIDSVILEADPPLDTAMKEMYNLIADEYWRYRAMAKDGNFSSVAEEFIVSANSIAKNNKQISMRAKALLDQLLDDIYVVYL